MSDKLVAQPSGETPPASPEVEFALALARTIQALKEDPAQLRHTVYEHARVALWRDVAKGDPEYGARLAQALETAIVGVERFQALEDSRAQRSDRIGLGERSRAMLPPSSSARTIAPYSPEVIASPRPTPAEFETIPPDIVDVSPETVRTVRRSSFPWLRVSLGLSAVLGILIVSAIAVRQPQLLKPQNWQISSWTPKNWLPKWSGTPQPGPTKSSEDLAWAQTTPLRAPAAAAPAAAPPRPDIPIPTTYGSFAINEGQLAELSMLEGVVPDKRVAIASPFQTPSRTVLPNGSPTFVVFRRDLASIPGDAIEVRVVAHIMRTMKFDAGAKPNIANEEDLWSVRGIAYKFKASPVPGYPEVMVVRPESPDIVLPPGRYALVLKRQGYDFTIAGKVTDPNHCLERTEAANGTFFSPCTKAP